MIFGAIERATNRRLGQAFFKINQKANNLAGDERCKSFASRLLKKRIMRAWKHFAAEDLKKAVDYALSRKFRYLHLLQSIMSALKQNHCNRKAIRRLRQQAELHRRGHLLANGLTLLRQF